MGIFGLKDALGGTLRQLLATSANISFTNTVWVDLGTLNWEYISSDTAFRVGITDVKTGNIGTTPNILCSKYKTVVRSYISGIAALGDKVINLGANNIMLQICDTSYTDATTFKAAMKGVLLAYEKA